MILKSEDVITAHTQMTGPRYLSICNDDYINLTECKTGLHQSADDGVSWNLVFQSTEKWYCYQVIKVTPITVMTSGHWRSAITTDIYECIVLIQGISDGRLE